MAKVKNNYVDNKTLYTAIVKYKTLQQDALESGSPPPRMPDTIGLAIMEMSRRMATKSNFSGYSFREDMVSDAIENGVSAIESFNPDKSDNPFGYLAITIYYAFLRRIQKEKRNLYTKYKVAENMIPDVEFQMLGSGETSPLLDVVTNPYMVSLAEKFEQTEADKTVKTVWKKKVPKK
jgi:DNA-directed RNA polymerase specialized sigma subunit